MHPRTLTPIVLLAAAALVLAACGSSSNQASSTRSSLLGQTVDSTAIEKVASKLTPPLRRALRRTAAAPSAHVVLSGQMVSGHGEFSTAKGIAALDIKAGCIGGDEVIVGKTMYLRSSLGTSKKWIKQDLTEFPATVSSGIPGANLLTFAPPLSELTAASHVADLGHERVDGVATTHYRARIGLPLKGFSRSERRQFRKMEDAVDVWVDTRDGYIRRARIEAGGTNEETVALSRFGEPVHVTVPPASQTFDASEPAGHAKVTTFVSSSGCHHS